MKAKKYIITEKEIDIDIEDITLLSIEEYETCKDIIPPINRWWWLRTPGSDSDYVTCVNYSGSVIGGGIFVGDDNIAIRPTLITKSPTLQTGDKIELFGYKWTVISDRMMLCDKSMGRICFRHDWRANDANDYEKSNIKKWLKGWLENKKQRL